MHGSEPNSRFGATPLFVAEGKPYTVDEAIQWAEGRGLLAEALHEARELLAAENAEVTVTDGELQTFSERFRYDHDLITEGETEDWLRARGMTVDDFARWLHAKLCRDAVADLKLAEESEDRGDFLRVHLWMSGRMDDLSRDYSRSVAADIEIRNSGNASVDDLVAAARVDSAKRRKLATMMMSLVRVEVDTLVVDSEAAGREAVMCVQTDRAALHDVAEDAGFTTERTLWWVDDLPAPARHYLLGAAPGDAVGPIANGRKFTVYQVLRRIEPSLDDPEVEKRVDQVLIDDLFDDLCTRHIRQPDLAHSSK
jgi:hypothetical protein